MTNAKKSIFILLLSVLALMFASFMLTVGVSTVRADDETKQTVETEIKLDEKDAAETGYVPDSDSEKKGATLKEEPEGDAEKEQPASKLATVKGIPDDSKLLPHYHILGKYQGYDVEVRAYSMSEHGPNYEYCDMFDYFILRQDIVWNNGQEPTTCSEYRLAVFDCLDCGEMVVFALSAPHTFVGQSEIVDGYEVKHCSECDRDICVDWFKHETIPEDDYVSLDIYIPNENTTVTLRNLSGVTAIKWHTRWEEIAPTKTGNDVEYSYRYGIKGRYYILIRGCTGIGDRAFADVVEVREINVSDDVESVGHNAFARCSNLDRICFSGSTPPEIESDTFSGCSAGIYVSDSAVNTYKTAWASYSDRIQGLSDQEFSAPTESEPTEAGNNNQFDLGSWAQNTSNNISDWLGQNLGIATTGSTVLIVGIVIIVIILFKRRR